MICRTAGVYIYLSKLSTRNEAEMKIMKPFTEEKSVHYDINGYKHSVYVDTRTGEVRNRWWTKSRVPGNIRSSRMPGGSSFRNNWEG